MLEHMFETLAQVERELVGVVDDLDPASLTPREAAAALERFAAIERRATAGRLLVAARAAESGVWKRQGHRSAAHWLAAQLGTTVAKARRVLGVSEDLEKAPGTAGAVRRGQLSEDQASEVAPAAAAAPSDEERLLGEAAKGDVAKLRETCRKAKLAAAGDEAARRERIRRSRSLRWFTDAEGATNLLARGLPEVMAQLKADLRPYLDAEFRRARDEGRREPLEAYAFDALIEAVRTAAAAAGGRAPSSDDDAGAPSSTTTAGEREGDEAQASRGRRGAKRRARRRPARVVVLADLQALRRGHAEAGETCEIPGVGPISVAAAREYLGDGLLSLAITDGVDVQSVVRLDRHLSLEQRIALFVRDQKCCVPSCNATERLQVHHTYAYGDSKRTTLVELALVCPHHHKLITHRGYDLRGGPGRWRWLTPDEVAADARPRDGPSPPVQAELDLAS